ncbi:hypothetical protein, partial [Pseudomonas aeruginosa]|uniref:hypothetical protein n=1 Tax=Pseudomonas aeruginosa TaxID=287 RepID=UPI003B7C1C17
MGIRSLVQNLPKDPDNLGWVLGWAVVQSSPWRFVDIYASEATALAEAASRGVGDLPPDFSTTSNLVESVFRAGDGSEKAFYRRV